MWLCLHRSSCSKISCNIRVRNLVWQVCNLGLHFSFHHSTIFCINNERQTSMNLKSLIRDIPDFPKPGILFRDITTLLCDPQGLRYTIDILAEKCGNLEMQVDYVVGMESRGFIFGAPLAYKLASGFVPVRKKGKLPAAVHRIDYQLEYGTDSLEVHQDALTPDSRVLIVDDLIATGGTASATAKLLEKIGCQLVGFGFIVELKDLQGRKHLPDVPIISLVEY